MYQDGSHDEQNLIKKKKRLGTCSVSCCLGGKKSPWSGMLNEVVIPIAGVSGVSHFCYFMGHERV